MVDYILNGWGDKGEWTLVNANFEIHLLKDSLKTDSGGYGEREFSDLQNLDWFFSIGGTTYFLSTTAITEDKMFFLEGDANPIIFRRAYGPGNFPKVYSIIYNNVVQDSYSDPGPLPGIGHSNIWKDRTSYYYTDKNVVFDYGTKKKIEKLRLTFTGGPPEDERWWNTLLWYYTQPISTDEDFSFIA